MLMDKPHGARIQFAVCIPLLFITCDQSHKNMAPIETDDRKMPARDDTAKLLQASNDGANPPERPTKRRWSTDELPSIDREREHTMR